MATSTLGSGTLVLAGTTSGTTTVTATAVAGTTTLTLPAATDTLVGKATTDTLTNKTLTSPTLTGVVTFDAGTAAAPAITTTGDTNTGIFFPAADTIAFAEGGAEVARFDSSGNFGLGVTPSAWGSYSGAMDFKGGGALGAFNSSTALFCNSYYNGTNYIYKASTSAGFYQIAGNQHQWYNAASGTAGNAISFTQAMTLDASGNLGIGTTSPTARLSVIAASANSTAATIGGLDYSGTKRGLTIKTYQSVGGDDCGVEFNAADGLAGYGAFKFAANTTTLATIDASGNLLVGTTSNPNSCKIAIGPTASNGISIESNSTSVVMSQLLFRNPNGIVGSVSTAGSLTSFNVSSDYRLKNTIAPMTGALAKVALLKPCTYKWNADGADGEGFIAHELAEVCPNAVTGEKDAVDKDGNIKPQGIDVSFLVATLTAAIQEQQALIQTLTARITALESA